MHEFFPQPKNPAAYAASELDPLYVEKVRQNETIFEQLPEAYVTYSAFGELVNSLRGRGDKQVRIMGEEEMTRAFYSWFNEERQEYIASCKLKDPESVFDLIALPPANLKYDQMLELASLVGVHTNSNPKGYAFYANGPSPRDHIDGVNGHYTDTGTRPIFMLMPRSEHEKEVAGTERPQRYFTPEEMHRELEELQSSCRYVSTPSVYDAIGSIFHEYRIQGRPQSHSNAGVFYTCPFYMSKKSLGGMLKSSLRPKEIKAMLEDASLECIEKEGYILRMKKLEEPELAAISVYKWDGAIRFHGSYKDDANRIAFCVK